MIISQLFPKREEKKNFYNNLKNQSFNKGKKMTWLNTITFLKKKLVEQRETFQFISSLASVSPLMKSFEKKKKKKLVQLWGKSTKTDTSSQKKVKENKNAWKMIESGAIYTWKRGFFLKAAPDERSSKDGKMANSVEK